MSAGGDVSDETVIAGLIAQAEKEFGPVDLYFANAALPVAWASTSVKTSGTRRSTSTFAPTFALPGSSSQAGRSAGRATSSARPLRPACSVRSGPPRTR